MATALSKRGILTWSVLLLLMILPAIGCSLQPYKWVNGVNHLTQREPVVPANPLYVVAMNVNSTYNRNNDLVLLGGDTLEEINRTDLMGSTLIFKFSQDPLGRIWIGYGGTLENYTKRVDVFGPDGSPIKSLELCTWPNAQITFANGHVFVPCYLNGFHAQMAIIDLKSLTLDKMMELTTEPRFSLLASASNQDAVITIGGSKTHATGIIIDSQTLDFQQSILIYGGADIFTILVEDKAFYLLNRGSSLSPDNPIDLRKLEISNAPVITEYQLAARDPLLGFIKGEYLWAYHHHTAVADDGKRFITRTNLLTKESYQWPLPDYWWAGDMIALNGKIVLTRRDSVDPNETDGLYEFSPETGKLTQILELPGAHLLLAPHGQGASSGDGAEETGHPHLVHSAVDHSFGGNRLFD